MKQMKILGVMAIALTLGLTACGGKGGSSSAAKHKHEYDAGVVTTQPTCTEAGVKTYTCKNSDGKCDKVTKTETVPALGHAFADPDVRTNVVPAECEKEGSYDHVCTRCGQTIHETVAALEHDWQDAADQEGAIAPTCTEPGTKIQECSLCHQKKSVRVAATGHEFDEGTPLEVPAATEKNVFGEDTFHWATITNYSCKKGDSFRYAWSAKEVNFDYKNEGVHWTQEEIDAAQEGDPAYGKTTADWKSEPNLLDDGEGVRFFGRPINNAMELNNAGDAADRGNTPKVPDPTVKGSRFEFDFVFDRDLTDVCLSAEFTPADYTSDVFKNGDNTEDWTPGYKNVQPAVDADGNPVLDANGNPTYTGEVIKPFRFYILLDGEEIVLDKNVSTSAAGRAWYQFPCKLNLSKGKHNLNIAMSGGYRHVFYQFSFEKVAPAHEHKYGAGTAQQDEAQSNIATCVSEDATRILWDANNFNEQASQVGNTEGSNGGSEGIIFSGAGYNTTANSDPSTGDHAVYNVNVPAAQTKAKLAFTINRKDATAVFSGQGSSDNMKCYTLDPATGKTTSTQNPWRYKLFINDVEITLAYADGEKEPKTVKNEEGTFTFPCEFALNAGVNKVELQKWGGYTPVIVSLQFVY